MPSSDLARIFLKRRRSPQITPAQNSVGGQLLGFLPSGSDSSAAGHVVYTKQTTDTQKAAAAPEAAQKSYHEAVKGKLPDAATTELKSTSSLKNGTQAYGGCLYVVSGELRSLEVGGQTRDMTYRLKA